MNFVYFELTGKDSQKFLQGQLTANVAKIGSEFLPSAICNLKGRVQFGLWLCAIDDGFGVVMADDLADDFRTHIKKYGAFSKIALSDPKPIYPCVVDGLPKFCFEDRQDWHAWASLSIAQGNFWITKTTSELFQPQELRLHQRGGVDYDKGCYLGQEIIARLWFKASPKAYLHRIALPEAPSDKLQVVNAHDGQALVVARPEDLADVETLPLPDALMQSVARG